jgi:response regulator RpfG family c-di-GMP phosphodiesterase
VYVWDALGFDHLNRPAWNHEDVLRYIKEQSGKYFDPQVVDAFLQLAAVNGQAFSSPA